MIQSSTVNLKVVIQIWFFKYILNNMRVAENEYDLYMRVDTNTNGHRQWFYFSIKCKNKRTIKLNIYRFKKPYSLFQRGMKPYVKSLKSQKDWKPDGKNVKYLRQRRQNNYGVRKSSKFFYVTFTYKFQYDQDQVFFAAGIPYTYSFLQQRIVHWKNEVNSQVWLNKDIITFQVIQTGKSMGGLVMHTIKVYPLKPETKQKSIIVINARTHSGQVSGSWVMDGIVQTLITSNSIGKWMKTKNICFHILPMLNPDGVFVGNYRTGIVGDDFNRKFNTGKSNIYPQLCYLKKLVYESKRQGKVQLFLDLHGHSILKNSFFYGPTEHQFTKQLMKKLPFYLWHGSKYFRMSSCRFKSQGDKMETARMYFQLKENILSFTCENSLGLYSVQKQTFQMEANDWKKFGQSILNGMKHLQNNKNQQIDHQFGSSQISSQLSTINMIKSKETYHTEQYAQINLKKINSQQKKIINDLKFKKSAKIQSINDSKVSQHEQVIDKRQQQKAQTIQYDGSRMINSQQQRPTSFLKEIKKRFPSLAAKAILQKEMFQSHSHLVKTSENQRHKKQFSNSRNKRQSLPRMSADKSFNSTKRQSIKESNKSTNQKLKQGNDKIQSQKRSFHITKSSGIKGRNSQVGKNLKIEHLKEKVQSKTKNQTIIPKRQSTEGKNIQQNPFDISLMDFRHQERSMTHDQNYLSSQIKKFQQNQKQKQKLNKHYFCQQQNEQNEQIQQQDQKINWDTLQEDQNQKQFQPDFDDKFSQNFDDSINDSDASSQDLPQQQKNYIMDYIRCNRNFISDKRIQTSESSSSSSQEYRLSAQDKNQVNNQTNVNSKINSFKEIVFKSTSIHRTQMASKQINHDLYKHISFNNNNKVRNRPHKFKQTLLTTGGYIKYRSVSKKIDNSDDQSDMTGIQVSQKKKLNQRLYTKEKRKQPYLLLSIKEKFK